MQIAGFELPTIGSRLFEELSAAEATAVATRAAEEVPAALARISADIGPPDAGQPLQSLVAAWSWLLDRLPIHDGDVVLRPSGPSRRSRWSRRRASAAVPTALGWDQIHETEVPYWCWFRDGSGIFGPLGPSICLDVDAVGAYVTTLLTATHPGATIGRSSGRRDDVDFRKPALRLPDGREFVLPGRFVVAASRAVDRTNQFHDRQRRPDALVHGPVPHFLRPRLTDEARAACPVSVTPADAPGFDFVVEFDDVVAHDRSDDLDTFVRRLADLPQVDLAHRDDREIVLVRAGALTLESAELVVIGLWDDLAK